MKKLALLIFLLALASLVLWAQYNPPSGSALIKGKSSSSGLLVGVNPLITLTPAVDGQYRASAFAIATTACTSGNIGVSVQATTSTGHVATAAAANITCNVQFNTAQFVTTFHAVAGQPIVCYTSFNSVVGSPVYNVDCAIEQLQ